MFSPNLKLLQTRNKYNSEISEMVIFLSAVPYQKIYFEVE